MAPPSSSTHSSASTWLPLLATFTVCTIAVIVLKQKNQARNLTGKGDDDPTSKEVTQNSSASSPAKEGGIKAEKKRRKKKKAATDSTAQKSADDEERLREQHQIEAVANISKTLEANTEEFLKHFREGSTSDAAEKGPLSPSKKSSKHFPVDKDRGEADSSRGTKLYKAGEYRKAIEAYSMAITKSKENFGKKDDLKVLYSNRGAAFEKLANWNDVIQDCTEALKLDPTYVKVLKRRANAFKQLRDERAELADLTTVWAIYQQHGKLDSELEEVQKRSETLLQSLSKTQAAEIFASRPKQQKLPPTYFLSAYYLSFIADEDEVPGDIDVLDINEKLAELKKNPEENKAQRGELLYMRAILERKNKKYYKAMEDLEAAVELLQEGDKYYTKALHEHGTFQHFKGNYAKAKECFEKAVAMDPDCILPWIKLAGLAFDQDDKEQAMEIFNRASKVHPTAPDILFHRGQLHLIMDQLDEAEKDFRQCLELAPNFPNAYVQLSVCEFRRDAHEKAVWHCKKAVKLLPGAPEVHQYLGEMLMNMERMDEALDKFEDAIKVDPTYPLSYVNKGLILIQTKNDFEGAIDLFKTAVDMDPACQVAYVHLAQLQMQLGQVPEALEVYEKAVAHAKTEQEVRELISYREAAVAQMAALAQISGGFT